MKFSVFYQQALARKGGEQALKSLLPPVTEKHRLAEIGDDRYLSEITRCIFKAGFVWRVIENKWPDFEAAFEGFVPAYWQQVPPEVIEQLATDERIVRNMQKIRTVPENARMIMDVAKDHGSFGQFLAQWPSTVAHNFGASGCFVTEVLPCVACLFESAFCLAVESLVRLAPGPPAQCLL